jgi:arylsulfatase A-like enzyme
VKRHANIWLLATWCALVAAGGELAMRATQKLVLHRYIYLSREIVWMTPLADVLLFLAVAALLSLIAFVVPRAGSLRVAASVFAALGALSILTMQPWMTWWAMLALALGFGYQAGVIAASREALVWRIVRLSTPVLLAAVVIAGGVQRVLTARTEKALATQAPPPPRGAPNVIVLVWDAVRAQNLSLYGYGRPTTPVLSSLAATGVTFDHAIATAPYTLPTHASVFTGLWPHQFTASWENPLEATMPTLAEALGKRGYRTGAFSANHILVTWEYGLLRGFSKAQDFVASRGELARSSGLIKWGWEFGPVRRALRFYDVPGRRAAPNIRRAFFRWADADTTRPFFAFLNVYDAHDPYLPPAPFDTIFTPTLGRAETERAKSMALENRRELSKADVARQIDLYDGAIAFADHDLGILVASLKERGLLDNTLLVILGDHGEAFGEHGTNTHGNDVYTEAIHVPMVVVMPGKVPAGVRVPGYTSVRDIPATIAELLGVAGPTWPLPGASLSRFWKADSLGRVAGDTVLSEVDYLPRGGMESYAVRRGNVRSLLAWPYHVITVKDSVELFDHSVDPFERANIAQQPERRAVRDSLVDALKRWRHDAVKEKL